MYRAVHAGALAGTQYAQTVTLSTHCHDDLGMAVANTLAGIDGGARQVECTINGIGERAGNAALEEIAAALKVRADRYQVGSNIVLEKLYPTSILLGETISFKPAPNKAIVGENAFAHEAGIHQHGMLANPLTYEIMTPASVGQPANKLVLGKHSGRAALRARLAELGFQLEPSALDAAYAAFTALADRKKSIYDQDLVNLAAHAGQHGQATAQV
jgi:2-isopropylmalate synthase